MSTFQLNHIALRTPDLARSTAFYTVVVGLHARPAGADRTALTASVDTAPLIVLLGDVHAAPRPPGTAGLFHAALLVRDRAHLAASLARISETAWPLDGLSDHGVSEALYLTDPDGNGVEIYRDRPVAEWPHNGDRIAMVTRRMDVDGVLAALPTTPPSPMDGAVLGHVHLEATSLPRSREFYERDLGLAVRQDDYPGAVFLAADGYHHHIAVNTWGRSRRPVAPGAAGLVEISAASARVTAPQTLTDPDGIRLALTPL
ncbi:MAG: VOC family protein [Opitutae bacterium]|nr:VOC family protein [Opitutae bacterium]